MPPYQILMVDDHEDVIFSYKRLLENDQVHVDTCTSQEEAFALLRARQYDAVITDYRLTHSESEEGIDILRYAKEKTPGVPVILLTAYGSENIKNKVLAYEATVFLDKPVLSTIIINLLKKLGIPAGKE